MAVGRFWSLVLVVACFGACKQVEQPTAWDFQPGSNPPLRDIPSSPDADVDVFDVFDGGDAEVGPPTDDVVVIPEEPAANAECTPKGWCWLHPAPLPHHIRGLRRSGDRVFGLASHRELRGQQLLIWDDSGPRLLYPDVDELPEDLAVSPSDDGWLAITRQGQVYRFTPEGQRQKVRMLPDRGYESISGISKDSFVAQRAGEVAVKVYDNTLSTTRLHSNISDLEMKRDGTIRAMRAHRETFPSLASKWRIFPAPLNVSVATFEEIRPPLYTGCDDAVWGYSFTDGLYHWDEPEVDPKEVTFRTGPLRDITCDFNNRDIAVGTDGIFHLDSPTSGDTIRETELWATSVATADGRTHISGQRGHLWEFDSDGMQSLRSGFEFPPSEDADAAERRFGSMWVSDDERRIALAYPEGISIGSDDGWSKMPEPPEYGFSQHSGTFGMESTEIWGLDRPRFVVTNSKLYRWDGQSWRIQTINGRDWFSDPPLGIAGSTSDAVWIVTRHDLFFYNGNEWDKVTDSSSDIRKFLEAEDIEFSDIFADDGGDIYAATGEDIYQVTGTSGNWGLQQAYDPPCDRITAMHRGDSGELYVGNSNKCVARFDGTAWTNIAKPPRGSYPTPPKVFHHGTHTFVSQGPGRPPLVVTGSGTFAVTPDDTLKPVFTGNTIDAAYLPEHDTTLLLTTLGVVAKYH